MIRLAHGASRSGVRTGTGAGRRGRRVEPIGATIRVSPWNHSSSAGLPSMRVPPVFMSSTILPIARRDSSARSPTRAVGKISVHSACSTGRRGSVIRRVAACSRYCCRAPSALRISSSRLRVTWRRKRSTRRLASTMSTPRPVSSACSAATSSRARSALIGRQAGTGGRAPGPGTSSMSSGPSATWPPEQVIATRSSLPHSACRATTGGPSGSAW